MSNAWPRAAKRHTIKNGKRMIKRHEGVQTVETTVCKMAATLQLNKIK